MKLHTKNNLKYYTFEHIDNTGIIKHAFSTRYGGVSTDEYRSMNLSFRDDDKENVIKNYKIICDEIGVDYKNSVFSSQIHSDKIYIVTKKDKGKGLFKKMDYYGYDALITNEKNIPLVTFSADCVPIFLVEPIAKCVGVVHSGWRGTTLNIISKAILEMENKFGAKSKNILAGISPSIGICHFQVGEEVKEEFEKKLPFSKNDIKEDIGGKYKIGLQEIIKKCMLNVGVLEQNIQISGLCTMCDTDLFFSHRAMGEKRGSLAGIISLC